MGGVYQSCFVHCGIFFHDSPARREDFSTVASFHTVHEYTKDPLVLMKLQVFIAAAKIVEPFLKKYQTDKPMLPFLATNLHKVLCDLLCRFVKGSALTPLKVPRMFETFNVMEKTAWLPLDHIDRGFAPRSSLEHLVESKKVSPHVGANFV